MGTGAAGNGWVGSCRDNILRESCEGDNRDAPGCIKRGGCRPSSGARTEVETELLAERKSRISASPTYILPVLRLRVEQGSTKPIVRTPRHKGMGTRKQEITFFSADIRLVPSPLRGTRPYSSESRPKCSTSRSDVHAELASSFAINSDGCSVARLGSEACCIPRPGVSPAPHSSARVASPMTVLAYRATRRIGRAGVP